MPTAPKVYRPLGYQKPQEKSPEAYVRARKYRTEPWERTKQRIRARDGMTCQMCQRLILRKGEAIVDHIVEVVKGGGDEDENLRLLCSSCHGKRHGGPNA